MNDLFLRKITHEAINYGIKHKLLTQQLKSFKAN